MKTNESTNACPKCGAPVPIEAPQGLCPQCVLAQAAAPEAAPTATSQIPSLERLAVAFPQLQILELIGRGGMGFVFKARQPHLDRFVALKLLPDSLAHDPHFAERFNREGRTLARLNHPNIVSVFDFGQAGGFYFLLMEYVDGVNLRQAMQAGRFSPSEALSIVPKICEALQFAHEEGVLHRDIKPENILLDAKGRVKIADFGIAKIVGEDKPDLSLTATGAALGTPHYMAPEQFEKPASVDHRADIYSLGVVFYEMLTGELPIGRFALPSQKTPVDPRVDDVVMRTLEKEREKRFQSASEMKTNVEHLTESGAGSFKGALIPPKATPAEKGPQGTMVINPSAVIPPVSPWSLKAVWGAVLVAISLVPVLLLLAFFFYFGRRRGSLGGPELILLILSVLVSLPAIVGTVLGWMGLIEIRAHAGQRRGLPLAVFAALAWPLFLLLSGTVIAPFFVAFEPSLMPLGKMLMLLVPSGSITFIIWAIYSAARWGANKPATHRRGVLKWVFVALLLAAVGMAISSSNSSRRERSHQNSGSFTVHTEPAGQTLNIDLGNNTNAGPLSLNIDPTPWLRLTFTAVELREVKGVRWLAIDYVDDVHGECQPAFPWETTIPGFKAETRTTAFVTDEKDGSPAVRHQRVEYRLPDSIPRDQLERLRDDLEKRLKQKSFRLELGENQAPLQLFELPGVEGGSFKARLAVVPQAVRPPGADAQPLAFGPVTERVITLADVNPDGLIFLNLEKAETLAPPFSLPVVPGDQNIFKHSPPVDEWIAASGADLAFHLTDINWGFTALGTRLIYHKDGWNYATFFDQTSLEESQAILADPKARKDVYPTFGARVSSYPVTAGYIFKTRRGAIGLIQITGFTNNSSGITIRYKLAEPRVPSVAAASLFGPVQERVLYDYKSGKDWLLNLESGETFSLPPGMDWDNAPAAVWKWAHERGIRVTGLNVASQHGLYGFQMKAVVVRETNLTFEAITPSQIADALRGSQTSVSSHNGGPPLSQLSGKDWKDLYAFETDDGRRGVLQVTGFVDNPRGVKFRYKLVQSDGTRSAQAAGRVEQAMPPSSTLQFRLVADDADTAAPVDVMMESRGNGASNSLRLLRTVLLDGSAVARAGIILEKDMSRTIGVELTPEGARQLGAITAANINRRLAIIAGGRVLSAPIIRAATSDTELQISGNISAEEARKLVAELNHQRARFEFSPAVERVLPNGDRLTRSGVFLDLESGRLMTNALSRAGEEMDDWVLRNGLDLSAANISLYGLDLKSVEAWSEAWDALSAEDVAWNWSLLRLKGDWLSVDFGSIGGRWSAVAYLFRTREGSFGVLQILPKNVGVMQATIRYKLVRTKAATMP